MTQAIDTLQYYPFKRQPHKIVKHIQTNFRQQPTNCLSVFDHFMVLALKGLFYISQILMSALTVPQQMPLHNPLILNDLKNIPRFRILTQKLEVNFQQVQLLIYVLAVNIMFRQTQHIFNDVVCIAVNCRRVEKFRMLLCL